MIPPKKSSITPSQQQNGPETSGRPSENRKSLSLIVMVIIGFLIISQLVFGIFSALNFEPSAAFVLLYYILLLSLIGYWLERDSRKHHITWVFDMGFFLYLAWPFIIPYYLLKTRGSKAFIIIIGYISLYIGANLLGRLMARVF
jgi:hypothetical protein